MTVPEIKIEGDTKDDEDGTDKYTRLNQFTLDSEGGNLALYEVYR